MKQSIKLTALTLVILTALTILLGSCSDDDSVDPSAAQVQLKMKATTSSSRIVATGRTTNAAITLRQALLGVTELEFDFLNDDGRDDDDIEFEGNFVVDLISGTSNPDFGIASVIPGVYDEIELDLEPILEGGNTIFIEMEYLADGASEPYIIEFSYRDDIEIEFERDAGFTLDGGSLSQYLVLLDLDDLFSSVDFSSANVDGDGTIRINEGSNASMASRIWSNLERALDAGEDDDGDDDIDYDDDDDDDYDDDDDDD